MRFIFRFLAVVGWVAASVSVRACGPFFPNFLLSEGDDAVLVAPEGNFVAELERMDLGRSRVQALPPGSGREAGDYAAQSTEAEIADLQQALAKGKTGEELAASILREHRSERQKLTEFVEAKQLWTRFAAEHEQVAADPDPDDQTRRPKFGQVRVVEGLPPEFADYFEGLIAWHDPAVQDKQPAREAWERLLARPASERRYKSTWAAFMLGKSLERQDPERAAACFQKVRELTRSGFKDTLGLGAASLGLEARVALRKKDFQSAIDLYLEQLASGDLTATESLWITAKQAITSPAAELKLLPKHRLSQKVITAYVISRPLRSMDDGHLETSDTEGAVGAKAAEDTAVRWLKAVEAAGVNDVASAETLAVAAYRMNRMDLALRWVKRAPNTPVAQWLQAKLLLRSGKLDAAAALLAQLSPLFPVLHEVTDGPAPKGLMDSLTVVGGNWSDSRVSADRQLKGELGVLRLARGEYAQALDALLTAGFWMDAAYVAERVLTADELKVYVDQFWPAANEAQVEEEKQRFGESEIAPNVLGERIRYLLARRLTRLLRGDEAREYYPAQWLPQFDELAAALRAGWDESLPNDQRATALFQAALITRTNGMELVGTELAPDWHYHDGNFEEGVTAAARKENELTKKIRPRADELARYARHNADPETRFHYRYQAASLAWEAAKLLPDNNDLTAYILWQGGCFLKARDPDTADLFYKALVNRNRRTALGAEADRQRWFPRIDEDGKIVPRTPRKQPPLEEPQPPPADQSELAPEPAMLPEPEAFLGAAPESGEGCV